MLLLFHSMSIEYHYVSVYANDPVLLALRPVRLIEYDSFVKEAEEDVGCRV